LVIDTVVCLTLAKWETVSGQFGGYLTEAIESLVGPPEQRSLPVAFDKNAITHKSTVR